MFAGDTLTRFAIFYSLERKPHAEPNGRSGWQRTVSLLR
jgi:hypothetical protein